MVVFVLSRGFLEFSVGVWTFFHRIESDLLLYSFETGLIIRRKCLDSYFLFNTMIYIYEQC